MFEAFKIAVSISLTNRVSTGLLGISRQFVGVGKDVDLVQAKITRLRRSMAIGGAMLGAGALGMDIFAKMLKPAEQYTSTINRLNMAGWSQVDIANAIGDAWKNTGRVITTTATQNLAGLLDLKNILGNLAEARAALPIVSQIQTVLAASSEGRVSGNARDLAYSMAKALDIIGAAKNSITFQTQAQEMAKVIIATQGRVTPEMFKSVFQYSRQAKYQMSDEYKYQILPALMQEYASSGGGGSGSRGVGPMQAAFYRWAVQGYINKKSLPLLESLGLVRGTTALRTTTQGTTVGAMKDAELAASNPFRWALKDLVPAIYKKYGKNIPENKLLTIVNEAMRGNQLAAALMTEFIAKPQNFIRDAANIRHTMSVAQAYQSALTKDPKTAGLALSAQWENLKTSAMMSVIPVLIPAMNSLSVYLNRFGDWARKNQPVMKNLMVGFAALSGAMAFGGALKLLGAGFGGIRLAIGGIAGLPTALKGVAGGLSGLTTSAGLFIAAVGGWKLGSLISDKISGTKAGDAVGSIVTYAMAALGDKGAIDGIKRMNGLGPANHSGDFHGLPSRGTAGRADDDIDLYGGRYTKKPATVVHITNVHLDGKKVASVVTKHQANAMSAPQTGTTATDISSAPPPIGLSLSPAH